MYIILKWNYYFSLAFILFISVNVFAQQAHLSKETGTQADLIFLKPVENEKLQQCSINKIYSAENGKLYLGTNSGLVCYDGTSTKIYSHINGDTNSLSQNNIVDIVEDKEQNLYLSTLSGGINYLDLKTGKAKRLSIFNKGPDWLIAMVGKELVNPNLYLDNDENLWIGSGSGYLYYYNIISKKCKQLGLDSLKPWTFYVQDINPDPNNNSVLWLATNYGICSINRGTLKISKNFRYASNSDSIPANEMRMITKLDLKGDGSIWFGTNGVGIGRYEINSGLYSFFKSSKDASSAKNMDISSLFKKNNFEYYVTSRNEAIYIYNIITKKYSSLPDQFLPKEFRENKDIIVDNYGNVWCIINGRLYVAYAEKNLFPTITIKDKIYNKDSIPNELKNIIWNPLKKQYYAAFDKSDEGLFILNDSLKLLRSVLTPIWFYPEVNGIRNVALDSKNQIWGMGYGGFLSVYDSNASKIQGIHFLNGRKDTCVYTLSKEKMVIWFLKYPSLRNLVKNFQHDHECLDILADGETVFTVNGDSLFFINSNDLTYKSVPFPLTSYPSMNGFEYKLRVDKIHHYLYASVYSYDSSNAAIFQYDIYKKIIRKILIPSSIRVPIYYAQYPWYELDDSGNIWVASSNNVFVYSPQTFKRIYNYEKKNKAGIKQLINFSGKGVMSMMSEDGIELYNYINDRNTHISVSDGLYSNTFQIAGYANNILFISYPGFLQCILIDSFLNKRQNRFCYFSEINIKGKEGLANIDANYSGDIKLKYYQNDITLTVSTTEFNQPQRLQYRYMLVGSDKNWNYTNFENRSITYRNLSSGTYTYIAAIKNTDGTWSSNELIKTITIYPAFWQTNWFKVLVFVCLAGLVVLIFKFRTKAIRDKEQKKTKHEKEILELEAKALRAQMNPHFIFNCMNSIKSLIQQHEEEKSVTYLTTFSKLIRTLFNNADKKEISLYDEIETCKLYLQLESMRFDTKFSYSVSVDENIDLKSIQVPALIIQPFIENAIWHGIILRNNGGSVSLNVLYKDEGIEVIIDDNGIGREASKQNKSTSGTTHNSKGVNLTQSRLELNNLLQKRQAELEVIDKKDEHGIATGTTVIMRLKEELS